MADVCLVYLPYGPLERPSLAYSLFKPVLQSQGIDVRVLYSNFAFAEDVGAILYGDMSWVREEMMGEWTFAGAAFPDFHPDHGAYLSRVAATYSRGEEREEEAVRRTLWTLRRKAAAFIERHAREVLDLHPRIVGCSSTFNQHCAALALTRRLKELDPSVVTILGGANCEGEMGLATTESFPWVDFVVSGEADEIFPALCRRLLERGPDLPPEDLPAGVFGPAQRARRQLPGGTAPRAMVQRLDDCPIPDFDDYFAALARFSGKGRISPGLLVETSRGCWWGEIQHCTFCGLNGGSMAYRSKSPTRAVAELRELRRRYGIDRFLVVDNILDCKYFRDMLPALAAAAEEFRLFYEIKANITYAQLKALRDAGATWLQPGIESLHDGALQLMRKGTQAWINVQLLKWARELGVHLTWNILCGFPGESDDWYGEMAEWVPLIEHLQPPKELRPIRFDRFSPYQARPEEFGLRLRPAWTYPYIYPLAQETLSRLVYVFELEEGPGRQTNAFRLWGSAEFTSLGGAGKDALQERLRTWLAAFLSPLPPLLCKTEEPGRTLILDTRSVAPESRVVLEGLAHRVYRACDHSPSLAGVVKALREDGGRNVDPGEVGRAVTELVERKLVLRLGERLLGLALRGEVPSLPRSNEDGYPGGWVHRRGIRRPPSAAATAAPQAPC